MTDDRSRQDEGRDDTMARGTPGRGWYRLWRQDCLRFFLAGLFSSSWLLQTWTGWVDFVAEQEQHAQQAEVFGPDGYVWRWGEATMENWQSEFLQLFTFVVLTSFLIHRGSAESKDSDEQIQASLERIERQLEELRAASGKRGG